MSNTDFWTGVFFLAMTCGSILLTRHALNSTIKDIAKEGGYYVIGGKFYEIYEYVPPCEKDKYYHTQSFIYKDFTPDTVFHVTRGNEALIEGDYVWVDSISGNLNSAKKGAWIMKAEIDNAVRTARFSKVDDMEVRNVKDGSRFSSFAVKTISEVRH